MRAYLSLYIEGGREEEQACPMGHYGVITAYRNAGQNCKTKSGKNSGEKLTLNFDNNLSLNKASPRCLLALNQVLTHLYLNHPRASCSTNSTPHPAIGQLAKGLRCVSCIVTILEGGEFI